MSIVKSVFGTLPDGRTADLYTLKNKNGMTVDVTNYGCRIINLLVPDRDGNLGDVILGHRTLEEYLGRDFQGSLVGRYANRIAGGEFTIDGKTYTLYKNDGKNALHGGLKGYHQVLWTVSETVDSDTPSITFTHVSPDGDEGFPGKLEIKVVYTLSEDNAFSLEYNAVSDAATPINFTNHAYFNLSGDQGSDVKDTELIMMESALFLHSGRTCIGNEMSAQNDVQSFVLKQIADYFLHRFRHEASAPVFLRKYIPDFPAFPVCHPCLQSRKRAPALLLPGHFLPYKPYRLHKV